MAKSYADIQKQIVALQKTAEALRQKEVAGVIERIKIAISTYNLSASDLGLGGTKQSTATTPRVKKDKAMSAKRKTPSVVRFRDDAGNSWSGRGRRPGWYVAALAAGKKPEDLSA